jgi:hypothetical protein
VTGTLSDQGCGSRDRKNLRVTFFTRRLWIQKWTTAAAALLGEPAHNSNLPALPMLSGFLAQGMSPSGALALLISGPASSLTAMDAVWGLASRLMLALFLVFPGGRACVGERSQPDDGSVLRIILQWG